MKIRQGFVSNSSSSSFTTKTETITVVVGAEHGDTFSYDKRCHNCKFLLVEFEMCVIPTIHWKDTKECWFPKSLTTIRFE